MKPAVFVTDNFAERNLFLRCATQMRDVPPKVWTADIPVLDIGRVREKNARYDAGWERCRVMANIAGAPTIMVQRTLRVWALGIGVPLFGNTELDVDPVTYVEKVGASNLVKMLAARGDNQAALVHYVYFCNPDTRDGFSFHFAVQGHLEHTGRGATFDVVDTVFQPDESVMKSAPWTFFQMSPDPSAASRVSLFFEIACKLPKWMQGYD